MQDGETCRLVLFTTCPVSQSEFVVQTHKANSTGKASRRSFLLEVRIFGHSSNKTKQNRKEKEGFDSRRTDSSVSIIFELWCIQIGVYKTFN